MNIIRQLIAYAIRVIVILSIALGIITYCKPVSANPTDWDDHYISQQISHEALARMEAEARQEWKARRGEWQPDLDDKTEKYLKEYTAQREQRHGKNKVSKN